MLQLVKQGLEIVLSNIHQHIDAFQRLERINCNIRLEVWTWELCQNDALLTTF